MKDGIEVTEYVRRNGAIILRSALPFSDPESMVQLWLKEFGDLYGFPWIEVWGEFPPTDLLRRANIDPSLVYEDFVDYAGLDKQKE